MPLPSNGPRLTCPLTHEALLLKNFNLREAGEGHPGTALRKGMVAAQHRLEDMGLREPDPNRVKVIRSPSPALPALVDTARRWTLHTTCFMLLCSCWLSWLD
jgi:hypothetical protein